MTEQHNDGGPVDRLVAEGGAGGMTTRPTSAPGRVSLFSGTSILVQSALACTAEAGATDDRWCAFVAVSTINPSGVDLWVVNVTAAAAAGASVKCQGGDPNCLRLTAGWLADSSHPTLFMGDTLAYFDNTGTPYAWRPGMPNGTALATATADVDIHDCIPASKGTAVRCLRDLVMQPTPGLIQSDILLGTADGQPKNMVVVDTIISSAQADSAGLPRGEAAFSPAGDYLAWSARLSPREPETLRMIKVGSMASTPMPTTVATDVSVWRISPDGKRWFWLSRFDYNPAAPSGTLQTAPFPAGDAPVTVMDGVGDYALTTAGGVVALAQFGTAGANVVSIADPVGAPMMRTQLDSGATDFLSLSSAGHVVTAVSQMSGTTTTTTTTMLDVRLKKTDGTGGCDVKTTVNPPSLQFFPATGAFAWVDVGSQDMTTGALVGGAELTRTTDCMTTELAPAPALSVSAALDDAVFYIDHYDSTTLNGSLKMQRLGAGNALATSSAPLTIHSAADTDYAIVPSLRVLIYTTNSGFPDEDGVYLFPLPAAGQ